VSVQPKHLQRWAALAERTRVVVLADLFAEHRQIDRIIRDREEHPTHYPSMRLPEARASRASKAAVIDVLLGISDEGTVAAFQNHLAKAYGAGVAWPPSGG